MKKKVKLFTTIASLCLAVALMAFGVYAATTLQYTITNQVTYTVAQNVKAEIWIGEDFSNIKEKSTKAAAIVWEDQTGMDKASGDLTDTKALGYTDFAPVSMTENMVYTYTLKIVNKAAETDTYSQLKVEFSKIPETYAVGVKGQHKLDVTTSKELVSDAITLEHGEDLLVTVIMTINPATSASDDLGAIFKLTPVIPA